jgi:hypothetical protein
MRSITAVFGDIMDREDLVLHVKANDACRIEGGATKDNRPLVKWSNKTRYEDSYFLIQNDPNINAPTRFQPTYLYNQQASLPLVDYNGTGQTMYSFAWHTPMLIDKRNISIFSVIKPDAVASCQSAVRLQTNSAWHYKQYYPTGTIDSSFYISSHWGTGAEFILSFDPNANAGAGLNNGITAGAVQINSQHWKSNTPTNGIRTYNNGALIQQKSSSNVTIPTYTVAGEEYLMSSQLYVGSYQGATEYFGGQMGDILIFSGELSDAERIQVQIYLNRKYEVYGMSDWATTSIGSESTISAPFSLTSFAPLCDYMYSEALQQSIAKTTKFDVKYKKIIEQNLANANTLYTQSGGYSIVASNRLSTPQVWQASATTAGVTLEVNIERIVGSDNIASLSEFYITDLVDGTTQLASEDDDYVSVEVWVEDSTNINVATTPLLCMKASPDNSNYYSANLTSIDLVDGRNIIRIRKSDFTAVGTIDWSDVVRLRLTVASVAGTELVQIAAFKLIPNYEESSRYTAGNIITVGQAVSSDDHATYAPFIAMAGRIDTQYIDYEDVSVQATSIIDKVMKMKLYEFDSMPRFSCIYDSADYASITFADWKKGWYTWAVTKLLLLAFPITMLDIDLDFTDEDFELDSVDAYFTKEQFIAWNANESLGDVLRRYLEPIGAYIAFDSVNGKLRARNAHKYKTDITSSLETPIEAVVFNFAADKSQISTIFNYMEADVVTSLLNGANFLRAYGTGYGFGNGNYVVRNSSLIGDRSTTFFNIKEITESGLRFGDEATSVYTEAWFIGGWLATVSETDTAPTNDILSIERVYITDDLTFITKWKNTGASRLVTAFGISWNSLEYNLINNYSGVLGQKTAKYSITDSIARIGKNTKPVDPRTAFVLLNNSTPLTANNVAQFGAISINNLDVDENQEAYRIQVNIDPALAIGTVIELQNLEAKRIRAYIIERELDGGNDNTMVLTVQRIV